MKELRPKLPEIVQEIDEKLERVTVTRRGHPVVVMMSVDEYEGINETLEVLSDKAGMERIKQGIRDIQEGRTSSLESVRKGIEHV